MHDSHTTSKAGRSRLERVLPPSVIINHKEKSRKQITIATLNVNGLGASANDYSLAKIPDFVNLMMKKKIDILAIQETRRPFSESHTCNGYTILLSSSNAEPRQQDKSADFMYKRASSIFKGKRAVMDRIVAKTRNKARKDSKNFEFAGVGFVISPQRKQFIRHYHCFSSREMHLTLNTTGAKTALVNMYLPQNGHSSELRELWYSRLTQAVLSYPIHSNTIVTGDLNAQIHQRLPSETDCLGNYTFGTTEQANTKASDSLDNRALFIELLRGANSIPINTTFQKSDNTPHHTPQTYRKELGYILY